MTNKRTLLKRLKAPAVWGVAMGVAAICLQPLTAFADQSPVSCNSNNLSLVLTKDKTVVRPGDTITYSVHVSNIDGATNIACDITNATVTITLPAADGTPTGTVVTLTSGTDYLAGTASTLIGTADYAVNVNPDVTDVVAQADIAGTLHDAPVDHDAEISKTVGSDVTQPHLTVRVTPNQPQVPTNVPVEYTYEITNDSEANAPIESLTITDNQCSPIMYASGDTNANTILDMNETWVYTCQKTYQTPGTVNSSITVNGVNVADARAIDPVVTTAAVDIIISLPGLPRTGAVHEAAAR